MDEEKPLPFQRRHPARHLGHLHMGDRDQRPPWGVGHEPRNLDPEGEGHAVCWAQFLEALRKLSGAWAFPAPTPFIKRKGTGDLGSREKGSPPPEGGLGPSFN